MDQPSEKLRILILEDAPSDAELEESELQDAGLVFTSLRVETRAAYERALDEFKPDIVIADFRLPAYSGRDALEFTRRTYPHIPVIMMTGTLGDEAAVELLKMGARDYVLKDSLPRLAPAVKRALSEERGIRNRKLAEGKYKALFAEAMDGIVLIDCETWQIGDCNPEFERQTGRTLSQLKDLKVWEVLVPEQHEPARQSLLEIRHTGSGRGNDFKVQKPGGELIPIEFSAKFLDIQQHSFIQVVTRDITERRRAEHALRESEEKFRGITASAQDAILMMDNDGKIVYWNAAAEKIFGYSAQEALGQGLHTLLAPERFYADYRKGFGHFQETGEGPAVGKTLELAALRKDGTEFPIELSLSAIKRDGQWNAIGILRDITERKSVESALRDEKLFSDQTVESLPGLFYAFDTGGHFVRWNRNLENVSGYTHDEVGRISPIDLFSEADKQRVAERIAEVFKKGEATVEANLITKDRRLIPYFFTGRRVVLTGNTYLLGTGIDITERLRADNALRRANRALRTLSAGNVALVRAKNEADLLRAVTKLIVEEGGYLLATVSYADDTPEKGVTPIAWAGTQESHYWLQNISWADTEQGQLPISKAIRNGTTQICRDIASDPSFTLWKDAALSRGYVSNIAMPLANDGRIFGGLSIYSSDANAFDEEEVRLLEELASDLAYGIITLRTRNEHEQHAAILRRSLEQSIQTIAGTVEARDPYTAGHQRRVAGLATAIAREMGLSEEQVNGIHLAAMIHDLGKIHIPAEILSRPGKLNDIEFSLIQTHSQAGYDIIKDVKFPWPIADIILQHHEKLDGSGYPHGLKDEHILLEAKILTVADVVEAISSHRPYRPALGIEAAFEELERNSGVKYDPKAVTACIKLFHERGYKLPS